MYLIKIKQMFLLKLKDIIWTFIMENKKFICTLYDNVIVFSIKKGMQNLRNKGFCKKKLFTK